MEKVRGPKVVLKPHCSLLGMSKGGTAKRTSMRGGVSQNTKAPPLPPSAVFCVNSLSLFPYCYQLSSLSPNSISLQSYLTEKKGSDPLVSCTLDLIRNPSVILHSDSSLHFDASLTSEHLSCPEKFTISSPAWRGGHSACVYHLRAGLALQMGCKIQFVCVETTPISSLQNIKAAN